LRGDVLGYEPAKWAETRWPLRGRDLQNEARKVERIVKKSIGFAQADEWDVEQCLAMTPEERLDAASELRRRAYGPHPPDVRESQRQRS
jgi:hypothetical protein